MRILSWNINGIRTIPQYHPWNEFKTFEASLNHLGADIICFQEMKSSRPALDKPTALPLPGYDSFFSFPSTKKTGYSGVAVYTSTTTAIPLKANEGLLGKIHPKTPQAPLSSEELILPYDTLPSIDDVVLPEDRDPLSEEPPHPFDMTSLDSEGRALMLDFGLFVLINLYCPNETSDARLPYKMAFHRLVEDRVRRLQELGREVMVVGDINVCAAPVDHCDGHLESNRVGFWVHPARKWFKEWLVAQPDEERGDDGDAVGGEPQEGGGGDSPRRDNGKLIDVLRVLHPARKGMYTCWNTKISARDTNYGTRIDYVLITPGLLPWIKGGDIQPHIKGSDHCPVFVDLHDEIEVDGRKRVLRDEMGMGSPVGVGVGVGVDSDAEATGIGKTVRDPPRLATRYWDEYSGKQKLLSSFFGKKKDASATPSTGSARRSSAVRTISQKQQQSKPPPQTPSSQFCEPTRSSCDSGANLGADSTEQAPHPNSGSAPTLALITEEEQDAPIDLTMSSPLIKPQGSLPPPPPSSQDASSSQPVLTPTPTAVSSAQADAYSNTQEPSSQTSTSTSTVVPVLVPSGSSSSPASALTSSSGAGVAGGKKRKLTQDLSSTSTAQDGEIRKVKRSKTDPVASSSQKGKGKAKAKAGGTETGKEKEKKGGQGQVKLSSFFSAGGTAANANGKERPGQGKGALTSGSSQGSSQPRSSQPHPLGSQDDPIEDNWDPSPSLSPLKDPEKPYDPEKKHQTTAQWTKLMTPLTPPRCTVHGEPAKEFVTKQGRNKGRGFWVCRRPVGPGYDKGRGARLRTEVDHQWKCDYFKWSSDVRKDRGGLNGGSGAGAGAGAGAGSGLMETGTGS